MYQSKLKAFRKQMEKESAVSLNLQDQIMNKLKEQFTHNSSAKYSWRLTDKTASQRREKVSEMVLGYQSYASKYYLYYYHLCRMNYH